MRPTRKNDALQQAITELEQRRNSEMDALKGQLHHVYDSLKPINLLKSTMHDIAVSPEIRNSLLKSSIGIGAGYLSKKILVRSSHNPIKQLLGFVVQVAVSGIITNNSTRIKDVAGNVLSRLFSKKRRRITPVRTD